MAKKYPYQSLVVAPLVASAIAYGAQTSQGKTLLHTDCFKKASTDFVKNWAEGFVKYLGVPWIAKIALERTSPARVASVAPLAAAGVLLVLNVYKLQEYAIAAAVLAVGLAFTLNKRGQKKVAEASTHGMTLRSRGRAEPVTPVQPRKQVSKSTLTSPSWLSIPRNLLSPFAARKAPKVQPPPKLEVAPKAEPVAPKAAVPPARSASPPAVQPSSPRRLAEEMEVDTPRASLRKRKAPDVYTDSTPSKKSPKPSPKAPPKVAAPAAKPKSPKASPKAPAKPAPAKRSSSSPAVSTTKKARK